MSSLKADLRAYLLADSTIAGIVDARVYPNVARQGSAQPFIVLQQDSSEQEQALDGPVGGGNRKLTIDCKSPIEVNADSLATAVKARMDALSCPGTIGSHSVGAVLLQDESDDFEEFADGSTGGHYVARLEYEIQVL